MGIESRDYIRESSAPRDPLFPWALPVALLVVWLVVAISGSHFDNFEVLKLAELSREGIMRGQLWRWFTYGFVHFDFIHLLFNCLGIFLLGRHVCTMYGDRFAFKAWFWGCVGGGMVWSLFYVLAGREGSAIGASAGVCCLAVGWCLHHYFRPVTVILYFFPVTMTGRNWLLTFLGLDLIFMMVYELSPHAGDGVAHTAHVGGMMAGFALFAGKLDPWHASQIPILKPFLTLNKLLAGRRGPQAHPGPVRPSDNRLETPRGVPSQAEIDRILDKINDKGFGSLSKAERATLARVPRR